MCRICSGGERWARRSREGVDDEPRGGEPVPYPRPGRSDVKWRSCAARGGAQYYTRKPVLCDQLKRSTLHAVDRGSLVGHERPNPSRLWIPRMPEKGDINGDKKYDGKQWRLLCTCKGPSPLDCSSLQLPLRKLNCVKYIESCSGTWTSWIASENARLDFGVTRTIRDLIRFTLLDSLWIRLTSKI